MTNIRWILPVLHLDMKNLAFANTSVEQIFPHYLTVTPYNVLGLSRLKEQTNSVCQSGSRETLDIIIYLVNVRLVCWQNSRQKSFTYQDVPSLCQSYKWVLQFLPCPFQVAFWCPSATCIWTTECLLEHQERSRQTVSADGTWVLSPIGASSGCSVL